jgi:predicted HicB family RNase H-like nuclease
LFFAVIDANGKLKKSQLKAKAAHYTKIVEWSDEDGCFVGSASPLIGECCHGQDEARVYAELCQIVEEWIEIFKEDGRALPEPLNAKKFSGKFVLRLEPALHRRLAAKAMAEGESLNSYCVKTLVKA